LTPSLHRPIPAAELARRDPPVPHEPHQFSEQITVPMGPYPRVVPEVAFINCLASANSAV
jgi:hypothetical protein